MAKIDLRKNSVTSNVALSLVEKTTISNPYYLFEFQNDITKLKYYQIFTDVSTVPIAQRVWNLFNIEVIDSGSGANKIILGNVGKYHYIIYEQASSSNLNPAGLTIVERGIMELVGSTEASIYVQHENIITYVAHEQ